MKKSITVHIAVQEKNIVAIPLLYEVEHENENVVNLHCEINLQENDRPEWLGLRQFTIRRVYRPGHPRVMTTDFGSHRLRSIEDGILLHQADDSITMAEQLN